MAQALVSKTQALGLEKGAVVCVHPHISHRQASVQMHKPTLEEESGRKTETTYPLTLWDAEDLKAQAAILRLD